MIDLKLNPRQVRFCQYYVAGLSAGKAYVKAGYKDTNSTDHAYQLLKRPNIQNYIDELQHKNENVALISRDEIAQKLSIYIKNVTFENADPLRAIEIYCKLRGLNEPELLNVSANVQVLAILDELKHNKQLSETDAIDVVAEAKVVKQQKRIDKRNKVTKELNDAASASDDNEDIETVDAASVTNNTNVQSNMIDDEPEAELIKDDDNE